MPMNMLARIKNLTVVDALDDGVRVCNDLMVINDPTRIGVLLTPGLRDCCGMAEVRAFEQPNCVVLHWAPEFWQPMDGPEIDDDHATIVQNATQHAAQSSLVQFNHLASMLWILHDNAVYVDEAFTEARVSSDTAAYSKVSLASCFVSAKGTAEKIAVTADDLFQADELRARWIKYLADTQCASGDPSDQRAAKIAFSAPTMAPVVGSATGSTRLFRFYYFLQTSRITHDLGVRITLYCIGLETLFTTANTQRKSQAVAQRVSRFLETDRQNQDCLFEEVREAYGIRSRIVHGNELRSERAEDLVHVSLRIDFLLRRVFGKILTSDRLLKNFELAPSAFERFLEDGDFAGE